MLVGDYSVHIGQFYSACFPFGNKRRISKVVFVLVKVCSELNMFSLEATWM